MVDEFLCTLFHTMTAGFNANKLSAMWLHTFQYFLSFADLHSDIATVSARLGLPLAPSEMVLVELMHHCLGTNVLQEEFRLELEAVIHQSPLTLPGATAIDYTYADMIQAVKVL